MKILIELPKDMYDDIISIVKNGTPIPDNAEVCGIEQLRKEIEARLYIGKTITHRTERDDYFDEGLKWCIELIDRHTQRERANDNT